MLHHECNTKVHAITFYHTWKRFLLSLVLSRTDLNPTAVAQKQGNMTQDIPPGVALQKRRCNKKALTSCHLTWVRVSPGRTWVHFTHSPLRFHLLPDNIVPPVHMTEVRGCRTAGVMATAGRREIQPEFKLCVTSYCTGERVEENRDFFPVM